jgi:hypothetical protein
MSRVSDYKIVGETLMSGPLFEWLGSCTGQGRAGTTAGRLVVEGECQCDGPLDTCFYCTLVQGQEALERLVTSDPFVEEPERAVGEVDEASAIE